MAWYCKDCTGASLGVGREGGTSKRFRESCRRKKHVTQNCTSSVSPLFIFLVWGAGCNTTANPATAADTLSLSDNGDGTASYSAVIGGAVKTGNLNLTSPAALLYGKPCRFLQMSSVLIQFQRLTGLPYNPNNVPVWLQKLGLTNVSAISGGLTVRVDHAPNQIPFAINPRFFASL